MNRWPTWIVAVSCAGLFVASAAGPESAAQPNHQAGSSAFVKITPDSLDFGNQPVGSATAPKTVNLLNTGPLMLKISVIVTSGIDFSQTNDCAPTLASGGTCNIQVAFKPAVTGPRVATLQILDSDPASPQSIVLNGTGQ